jgi:alpha-beta hydrolase superfamily lysophospholipase
LKKVDEAVAVALAENPDAEIVLLAHSIGGTVRAALYLQIESHLDATIVG